MIVYCPAGFLYPAGYKEVRDMKTVITAIILATVLFLPTCINNQASSSNVEVYQLFISTNEIPVFVFYCFEYGKRSRPNWEKMQPISIENQTTSKK